jgi:3-oxoacyl-[acyl-carrier protein] reductase
MFFDLSGQTAIVTGAGRGIGAGIASRLARAGARVAVADFDLASAEKSAASICLGGDQAFAVQADVSQSGSVAAMVERVAGETGQIHILVNNAGIGGNAAPVWEQSDEDWRKVMDVNLTGVFLCCRAVIPHMREHNYGRIINIASVAGKEGNPNMVAYSASKAGVIAIAKSLAKEVATENICVNAVTPAVIRTPILDQLTAETVEYMISKIPRGRTGEIEEVAAVVHFLASPDCSFVTGQTYDVSGGRSTY